MVLESHLAEAGDERSTPQPIAGRHLLCDCNVWDHSGQVEDIVGRIQLDNKENKHNKHKKYNMYNKYNQRGVKKVAYETAVARAVG